MSKTIPSVPESFTREQYMSFFRAVGIRPEDTVSLRFDASGVHATVFAKDDEGRNIVNVDEYAKHTIFIPVDDAPTIAGV